MRRVLRPSGKVIISFTNRLFPTKAVDVWTRVGAKGRLWTVGAYLHFAGGFTDLEGHELVPETAAGRDPLHVVQARRSTLSL